MVEITDRKHDEAALRNSEARYRDIVEHSVYRVCTINAAGKATTANSAMMRILGCTNLGGIQRSTFSARCFPVFRSASAAVRRLPEGSLFRVYFQTMPGGAIVASVPAPNGTETVMIAEDHESIREMARQTLASLGYRVLCAGNGEQALRLCEQGTPDMAVLDVVMPKPGGLTTAEQLLNHFPGLPLIFASGYSHDHDVRTADLPMASYLQKPYSPTHLGRRVHDVLDEGKNTQPPA
jgi:CheY-like chemotaxis protein